MASALWYVGLKGESGDINDIAYHFQISHWTKHSVLFKTLWKHAQIVGVGQPYNNNK